MVKIANIITVLTAGASVASATVKRRSANAAEIRSAVDSYVTLLQQMSDNIATGNTPTKNDMYGALETYMGMMGTVKTLFAQAPNSTAAPFKANWEGAIIGAGISSLFGGLTGALLGVYTDWTFKGFNDGVTAALGFDPTTLVPPAGNFGPPGGFGAPPGGFGAPGAFPMPNMAPPAAPPPPAAPKAAPPSAPKAAPPAPPATPKAAPPPAAASSSSPSPAPAAAPKGMGMTGHAHSGKYVDDESFGYRK